MESGKFGGCIGLNNSTFASCAGKGFSNPRLKGVTHALCT